MELSKAINDCHIHLGESNEIYTRYQFEEIFKLKHEYYIDKILLFPASANPGINNFRIQQLVKDYDDVFGLEWIGDDLPGSRLRGNMIGYKFHGVYNKRLLITFDRELDYLDKQKKILMVHCGRYLEGSATSLSSWLHAYDIAKEYKNIKVIMAHMGGTDTTICKQAIKKCADIDNVYFDTSGITTPYIIEYACKWIPSTRILFGSDVPWCSFRAMYYNIIDANIPDKDKSNILHESFDLLVANILSLNNNQKESSDRLRRLSV